MIMSFAEIKKAINSNLNKTLDALITEKASSLSAGISDNKAILNNSTYGLSALKTAINTVISNITGGKTPIVKSVQRGEASPGSAFNIAVTINAVNVNKSILIIENGNDGSKANTNYLSSGAFVSSTSIKLYTSNSGARVPWQVIEFY